MKIYVGNLSYRTTEDALKDVFDDFGDVDDVAIICDRETGRSRGYGFISMDNDQSALEAIESLQGRELDGRPLTINQARKQAKPSQ